MRWGGAGTRCVSTTTDPRHAITIYYHEEHQLPHVQVRGEHDFSVAIVTGELLTPKRPPPPLLSAVRAWLEENRSDVLAALEAARRHEPLPTIGSDEESAK